MSIELVRILPAQPSTERARKTPLSYDSKNDLIAYGSGKQVIVRSVANPETATNVYVEHLHPVTSVAFSPSGFYVASGDANGQVRIWNHEGDETVTKGPYQVTSSRLNGIDWCGESQRVIAVGDGRERFGHGFTADSGNTIGEISGHSAEVHAVAIKPNRPMRAVTVGEDGNAVFYEGPPFRFARSVSPHTSAVSDVAYSPDGAYFVTAGLDRKVGLYDGKSGDFLQWLDVEHEGMVLSVAFASNTMVVSVSADCSVRLTDVESGKLVQVWKLPKELSNQQTGVVAAKEFVISVSLNGDLHYWQKDNDAAVKVVQGHQKAVTALGLHSDIFTGSVDGTVVQWFPDGHGVRLPKAGHDGPVCGIVGDIWSAGWDSKITKIGDESTKLVTKAQPLDVAMTSKFTLTIADETLELVGEKSVPLSDFAEGSGACVHAVGDMAAVGVGNTAVLLKLPDVTKIHAFDQKQSAISAVQISPDGKLVAVGETNGKIALYSTETHALVTSRWTFHTSRVTSIAWAEDSKRVVTGSSDTNIFVYSVERPARNIKTLGAHKDGVSRVAWMGDTKFVSTGADGAVKEWKLE